MICTENKTKSAIYRDIENSLFELTMLTTTSGGLSNSQVLKDCAVRLQQVARLLEIVARRNLYAPQLARWQETFAQCERAYRVNQESPDPRPVKRTFIQRIRSIESLRPGLSPLPEKFLEISLRNTHHRARSAVPYSRKN